MEECNVRWEVASTDWETGEKEYEMYCGQCDTDLTGGNEDWLICPKCGLELIYHEY